MAFIHDQGGRPDVFVLGRDGLYKLFSSGRPPFEGRVPKKDVSYLEAAALFFGVVYVCGGQNQVLRYLGGRWEDISSSIVSVDAYDNLLWMSGGKDVWRFDGDSWESVLCPDVR